MATRPVFPSRTPIGFLLRCWVAVWLPVVLLVILVASHLLWGHPGFLGMIAAAQVVAMMMFRLGRRAEPLAWRVGRRVLRHRAVRGRRASVLYPDGLDGPADPREVLEWAEAELDDLARWFGSPLRRRPVVVLLPGRREVAAEFGRPMSGFALFDVDAAILAADYGHLRELLRHELVHLFAARWNSKPHYLLQEGLAMWLQGTEWGHPVESWAGRLIRRGQDLAPLLDAGTFFAEADLRDHYLLAGGFTGFLIRRIGWDAYRELYRRSDGRTLPHRFRERTGVSLEGAWRRWRDESMAMDALGRRLREDRLFN